MGVEKVKIMGIFLSYFLRERKKGEILRLKVVFIVIDEGVVVLRERLFVMILSWEERVKRYI